MKNNFFSLLVFFLFTQHTLSVTHHAFYIQVPNDTSYYTTDNFLIGRIFKYTDSNSSNFMTYRSSRVETITDVLYGITTADGNEAYEDEYLANNLRDYRAFKAYVLPNTRINPGFNYYVVWNMFMDYYNGVYFNIKYFNCREEAVAFKDTKTSSSNLFFYDGDAGSPFDDSAFINNNSFTQRNSDTEVTFKQVFMMEAGYDDVSDGTPA